MMLVKWYANNNILCKDYNTVNTHSTCHEYLLFFIIVNGVNLYATHQK